MPTHKKKKSSRLIKKTHSSYNMYNVNNVNNVNNGYKSINFKNGTKKGKHHKTRKSLIENSKQNMYIYKNLTQHSKKTKTFLNMGNMEGGMDMQVGGIFGIDYIKLKLKIYQFKKIIKKINKFDKKIKKEIDSIKSNTTIFEEYAIKKAKLQTEFINNYKAKIILQIYQKDTAEAPETNKVITRATKDSLENIDNKLFGLDKRIVTMDNEIGKKMPEYNRLFKQFSKNADLFTKIGKEYANVSGFQEEIEALKTEYDTFLPDKNKKITSEAKNKIKKYTRNKQDYDKILTLNRSELERHRKTEQEINDFFQKSQYFIDQFGEFSGKKKIGVGMLDIAAKKIKCEGNGGLLCKWSKNYTEFASYLISVDESCKYIKDKVEEIHAQSQICVINLSTVYKDTKSDADPQAVTRFENDISHLLKKHLSICVNYIKDLKRAFYNQVSATQITIDYASLTAEFNHIGKRLDLYAKIFDTKQTIPEAKDIIKKPKKGGYMKYMYGGAVGAPGAPRAPRPIVCTTPKVKEKLTNRRLYNELHISEFNEYRDLYDEIKNKNPGCFDNININDLKIICANYLKIWLFILNLKKNLNDTTTNLNNNEKNTISFLVAIDKILAEESAKGITTISPEIKDYIADKFTNKIESINMRDLPDYYKDGAPPLKPSRTKTLKAIYDTNAPAAANPITNPWVNDMLLKVFSPLPKYRGTDDDEFFGVLEWDSTIATAYLNPNPNPPYPIIVSNFKTIYDNLKRQVDADTTNIYKIPAQAGQPAQAAQPAQPAQAQIQGPIKNIEDGMQIIKKITELIDLNQNAYDNEYIDFVSSINNEFKKQFNLKIEQVAEQEKIFILLNKLDTQIHSSAPQLTRSDIIEYEAGINNYKKHLAIAIKIYEEVIANKCSETLALQSVKDINILIANGNSHSFAYNDVIKKPIYICNAQVPSDPIPPIAADAIVADAIKTKNNTKQEVPLDSKYTPNDVQTIKNVLYRFYNEPGLEEYFVQRDAIKQAYIEIYRLLQDITGNSDKSSKKLGDKLQKMAQLLLELKIIEPKLVDITVEKDTSIKLNLGDYTLDSVKIKYPDSQISPYAKQLQDAREEDRDLYKIYEEYTAMSSQELNDIFNAIIMLNPPSKAAKEKLTSNSVYMSKLDNEKNLQTIIDKLILTVQEQRVGCSILNELGNIIGSTKPKTAKIIVAAKAKYDGVKQCVNDKNQKGQKGYANTLLKMAAEASNESTA